MLCNRVDPFGTLHATPHRGDWFGNRGCLHDDDGRIRRFHVGRRWITCLCAFKNRKRPMLQPGRYTELFFFDEATAYAAGHRPCAECRRAAWDRFRAVWMQLQGGSGRADDIDRVMHAARLDGRVRRTVAMRVEALPDGVMIDHHGVPLLRRGAAWWRWDPAGYTRCEGPERDALVLTPAPVVALLAAGLPVQIGRMIASE